MFSLDTFASGGIVVIVKAGIVVVIVDPNASMGIEMEKKKSDRLVFLQISINHSPRVPDSRNY